MRMLPACSFSRAIQVFLCCTSLKITFLHLPVGPLSLVVGTLCCWIILFSSLGGGGWCYIILCRFWGTWKCLIVFEVTCQHVQKNHTPNLLCNLRTEHVWQVKIPVSSSILARWNDGLWGSNSSPQWDSPCKICITVFCSLLSGRNSRTSRLKAGVYVSGARAASFPLHLRYLCDWIPQF